MLLLVVHLLLLVVHGARALLAVEDRLFVAVFVELLDSTRLIAARHAVLVRQEEASKREESKRGASDLELVSSPGKGVRDYREAQLTELSSCMISYSYPRSWELLCSICARVRRSQYVAARVDLLLHLGCYMLLCGRDHYS